MVRHVGRGVGQVAARAAGNVAGFGQGGGAFQQGRLGGVEPGRHARGARQVEQVADEAVAGHVGGGMGAGGQGGLGGGLVQLRHGLDGGRQHVRRARSLLDGGRHDAGAQRLGQHQAVSRASPVVGEHLGGVHLAHGHHAVLGFGVVDGVASQHGRAGFGRLLGAASHDLFRDSFAQQTAGERQQVQHEQGPAAHGVDVRQGVGGGDAAEVAGVVHHRRKEVQRHDQRPVRGDPVDGGVVHGRRVHEDSGVVHGQKGTQDLRQLGLAELARSPGPVGQGAQADLGPLVAGDVGAARAFPTG